MTVVAAVRRFLEILHELHKLGYERLRIAPEIADTPGGGLIALPGSPAD